MTDDLELLIAWRAGDRAAGDALLSRYRTSLTRFFGRRAAWDTDDLVQETLLACVRCRDRFVGQSSFRTYVFAIAKRILQRAQEQQRQRGEPPAPGGARTLDEEVEPTDEREPWPDEPRSLWERWDVWKALQRLQAEDRRLIWLYYWNDLSGPKLALTLGVVESTARSRLRRSLERMRSDLRVTGAGAGRRR